MLTSEQMTQVLMWAQRYAHSTPNDILLHKNEIPASLKPHVATQLALQKKWSYKVPSLANDPFFIPERRVYEQASSEASARYKASYLSEGDTLFEATGGAGIDFLFMAQQVQEAYYCEAQESTWVAARFNLEKRFSGNTQVHFLLGDCMHHLNDFIKHAHSPFVMCDPARRDNWGNRSFLLQDTEPSPMALVQLLQSAQYSGKLLLKVSPLLDVYAALNTLNSISKVDIVSVDNEVKELLLYIPDVHATAHSMPDNVPINVVELLNDGQVDASFTFTRQQELSTPVVYASQLHTYIYVPSAAMMKAGAYKTLAAQFDVLPLHPNTHLYTGGLHHTAFPGKVYRVIDCIPFSKKEIKRLKSKYPEADITVRNFPYTAQQLYQLTRIKAGSACRMIATTMMDDKPIIAIVALVA